MGRARWGWARIGAANGLPAALAVCFAACLQPDTAPPSEPGPNPAAQTSAPAQAGGTLVPPGLTHPIVREGEDACDARAEEINAVLAALASPCESPTDCEVLESVCPLGCYAVVSKAADRTVATVRIAEFFEHCTPCKSKCTPTPTRLACVRDRCVAADP